MADQSVPSDTTIDISKSEPAHFVRTFATDAAAVQSGLKADFTTHLKPERLKETPEDILARLSANAQSKGSSPLDINATELQAQARPEGFAEEPVTRASERLVAPSPVLEPIPEPPPAPPLPPMPPLVPKEIAPEPIHTYQSDFRAEVKDTGASKTAILAREQDAGPRPAPATQTRSNTGLYVAGAILFVLGIGGATAAYLYSSNKPTSVAVTPTVTSRIFVDNRTQITGSGNTLVEAMAKQVQTSLALGGVRLLYVSTSTANGSDVFSLLRLPAPDILLRNIESANSIAGIVNSNGAAPFFILSVDSYGDTFAGMLAWEPRMQADLNAFYPLYPAPVVAFATSTPIKAKTASSTPAIPGNTPTIFVDQVVNNHDARALKDRLQHTLIIYGYFDSHTLVIARSEAAFTEIINRLTTSRTQKQ